VCYHPGVVDEVPCWMVVDLVTSKASAPCAGGSAVCLGVLFVHEVV